MAFLAALLGLGGGAAAGAGAGAGAGAASGAAGGAAGAAPAAGAGAASAGGKGGLPALGQGPFRATPTAGFASGGPGTLPPVGGSAASQGILSAGGTGAGTGAGVGAYKPTTATPSLGELTNMGDIMPASSSAGLGVNMGNPAAPLGTGAPFAQTPGSTGAIPGFTASMLGGASGGGMGGTPMSLGHLARRYWLGRLGIPDPEDMDMMRNMISLLASQRAQPNS